MQIPRFTLTSGCYEQGGPCNTTPLLPTGIQNQCYCLHQGAGHRRQAPDQGYGPGQAIPVPAELLPHMHHLSLEWLADNFHDHVTPTYV